MGAVDLHCNSGPSNPEDFFMRIAKDIEQQGYSIQPNGLPPDLAQLLANSVQSWPEAAFSRAGIGRADEQHRNDFVRRDEIRWINGDTDAGTQWLQWTDALQQFMNRRLFLGLFSFESHFAHYSEGAFYKRHYDAFRGESNRVLTVVTYLNSGWTAADGGEIVLYLDDTDQNGIKIQPTLGTVIVFLSEEFPHEVLPAKRDRYSIAGWYRLNNSLNGQIDPPR